MNEEVIGRAEQVPVQRARIGQFAGFEILPLREGDSKGRADFFFILAVFLPVIAACTLILFQETETRKRRDALFFRFRNVA